MHLEDYYNKTKGFPSVQVINLEEHPQRKKYMIDQFNKYGLKYKIHTGQRFVSFRDKVSIEIVPPVQYMCYTSIGIVINFVNAMRDWYFNTNEDYAIFCDDDISFESIEYWNFTWHEFASKLPECNILQLVRIPDRITNINISKLDLQLRQGRWWGSSFLLPRERVKILLDLLYPADNVYRLTSENGRWEPCIENCIALNYGYVLNLPLLFENNFDLAPGAGIYTGLDQSKIISQYLIRHWWRTIGKDLDLERTLSIA